MLPTFTYTLQYPGPDRKAVAPMTIFGRRFHDVVERPGEPPWTLPDGRSDSAKIVIGGLQRPAHRRAPVNSPAPAHTNPLTDMVPFFSLVSL